MTEQVQQKVVGLTGGIASGKSAVARIWRDLGITVVDADLLAREAVVPGSVGLERVQSMFGSKVLLPDGSMDRAAIGRLVFSDPQALAALNGIIHPLVAHLAKERLSAAPGPYVVYDVPLLVETGGHKTVDKVVVVAAEEALQVARIQKRDGLDETEARQRIASQLPLEDKVVVADYIIRNNNGPMEELAVKVCEIHERLVMDLV